MKMLKQTALLAGILATGLLSAQSADMRNMLKVGANVGVALPQENASMAAGIDVAYQNLGITGLGLGLATGYTHYFGRDNKGINNNDFGVIPVAALFRVYPKQTGFYFGTDLGYGFIVGDDKVAKNFDVNRPDGGFYINPEIGYHNRDWNFALHYQRVFTGSKGEFSNQNYGAGNLGAAISYNIPLGKGKDVQ